MFSCPKCTDSRLFSVNTEVPLTAKLFKGANMFFSPSALTKRRMMSSANIRASNVVSSRGHLPDSANSTSSPLMKRLNSSGLKLQPCRTPFWHLNTPVAWDEFILTLAVAFLYMDCSIAMI